MIFRWVALIISTLSLAGAVQADDAATSFAIGFYQGLNNAIQSRQGYYPQQYPQQNYQQIQQRVYLEDRLELLQQQTLLLEQHLDQERQCPPNLPQK